MRICQDQPRALPDPLGEEMPESSLPPQRKAEMAATPPMAGKIRKRSLETNSPLCDHDNAKIPTHLLPRIITSSICIILESLQSASTGCLLSDGFYLSLECVDSSDVKPSNSPASACLSRPVSLPNWSHGHGSHPLGCDLLPLNGLPLSSLKNGKS